MQTNSTPLEPTSGEKTILGRERVLELIEAKKTYLASVFTEFEPIFDAVGLYQTPDNGWQVNFIHSKEWNKAAMTLRPGDRVLYEVHGGICGRWYGEKGAWDNGVKGWLGWPVSDQMSCEGDNRISFFENGTIYWDSSRPTETLVRPWDETMEWLGQEAARGHAWAQVFLGDCFLRGLGVSPDYGKAFKWYNAAKENGMTEVDASIQMAARQFIRSL